MRTLQNLIFLFFVLFSAPIMAEELPLHLLKLPKGFSISIFASNIEGARSMALGDKGTIFVGSRDAGNVYAISPGGNKVRIIATGLSMPNGIAFFNGDLYVAEFDRILKFPAMESHLTKTPKPTIIYSELPTEKEHNWRYIKIGPDGKLYISIGAPCNVCVKEDKRFATIARMNLDGSGFEIFARGVRNSLGFAWNPLDHKMWFTDNSRDWMDDDTPPEELNFAPTKNLHFGFPYCFGKTISDPQYGKDFPCAAFTPAVFEMPAHTAPLGMVFYQGSLFPEDYRNQIFIAEHGSWNRRSKIGYQVISVKLKNQEVVESAPFITGWLQGEEAWGRPVDFLVLPDGALLISDDYANVIYKVTYHKN